MKKLTLLIIALLYTAIATAQTFTIDQINYLITSTTPNTVTITSETTASGDVIIPSTVTNNKGVKYIVTQIGELAFNKNDLTSVIIPNTVTTIRRSAFSLNKLTSITIPNSVTTIGDFAFFNNNELTSVTISANVTTIGDGAFGSNEKLTKVVAQPTTPPTINTTGGDRDTFGDRRSTIDLEIPAGTRQAYLDNGWIDFKSIAETFTDTETEITYEVIPGTTTVTITKETTATGDVIIPSTVTDNGIEYTVTVIGDNAFANNQLTSVTIPDSVIEIGSAAFLNNQLTSVTIPDSVTTIGSSAFNNSGINNITLSKGIITISEFAFSLNKLTEVKIPESVTTIGAAAFQANQLTSITIPNSVTIIGDFAFSFNKLADLTLGTSVTTIGERAFQTNLITTVTLPNSVTTIGGFAFKSNQITSITLPNSVTTIGNRAFAFNNDLIQVIARPTSPPTITPPGLDNDPFADRSDIDLLVPQGTKQAYLDNGWIDFKSIEEITLPQITLTGATQITIELGDTFTDPGATAVDSNDVDITGNLVIDSSDLDTSLVGSYIITYNVTDAAGNKADQVNRTVNVVDSTSPVITLNGDNPQTIPLDGNYTELGATVTDLSTTDIDLVIDSSAVDTSTLGTYTVTYNATDASGNEAEEVTRTVIVADITPPVITLLGDNLIRIELNTTFTDPGATALDNVDGDITDKIDIDNPVDTSVLDTYTIIYTVSDTAGNTATLTRTVEVVQETTPPVITLLGDPQITIELGDTTFTDPGATALDNNDGDITDKIITTNPVDIAVAATYTITYTVTDAAGNKADPVNRTVNVVDTTPPVITLNGDNPQTIPLDGNYTELGATVTDLSAGDIEPIIDSSAINTSVAGSYTVTYNATDAAGNTAVPVDRTVIVADTTPPVITLLGDNPQRIELGDTFTDPGATALDNNDGDLTNSLTIDSSAVDTSILGDYLVTYTVTDAAGNTATLTRTVQVVQEATAPVITLLGDQQITLELGDTFTDPGATAVDNSGVDITNDIITNNPVDTAIADTYTITYNVTDASGNTAVQVIRTVIVQDTTPPVITLNGDNPQRIQIDADYIELGATVTDLSGGDIDPVIDSSAVDTSVLGDYTVTYNATDASGNLAIQVTRTVIVTECPIANDNFTLQSLAETCSGKNNGAIRINAKTELDYTLTINEQQLPFTSELLIADLAPATYPICITANAFNNCQQCFEVVINPGINIAGTTAIQQQAFGNTKLQVAIQTGTPPYTVYVNGLQKTVSQNKNFSISVANGDQVEVSSALECQGKLTTKVQLEDELQLYPNPTQGDVTLTLGTTALKNIQVVIYNPLGIAVSKAKLSVTNRQVIIPMSTLSKGMYILQLPEIGKTFKVIKN